MNEVMKTLVTAKEAGMTAYKVDGHDTFGYIITPKGNVLGVNKATWSWGDRIGVTVTLKYKPNRKCGSGCSCMERDDYDFGVRNVTADDLLDYEKVGLDFANKLKASMYKSVEEWKADCYWNGRGLQEIW